MYSVSHCLSDLWEQKNESDHQSEKSVIGHPLTSGRGRKQPSPRCPPALAAAIAVAAVVPVAIVVVPVHGRLVRVMSVDTTKAFD